MGHKLNVVQLPSARQAAIDEYGEICRRLEEFKPVSQRHAELKAEIRSWYDGYPADETAIATGRRYTIHVGTREWQRKISDMGALFKLVGARRFLEHCSFPLGCVEDLISGPKLDRILNKGQTGLRSVKAVPKGSNAPD